jgi:hypothetical protein
MAKKYVTIRFCSSTIHIFGEIEQEKSTSKLDDILASDA